LPVILLAGHVIDLLTGIEADVGFHVAPDQRRPKLKADEACQKRTSEDYWEP
jgi:hypothetical protein